MSNILNFLPTGYTPREGQKVVLPEVEKAWNSHDVIVIEADTGAGKSVILQTIARWRAEQKETTATLTPRVTLQDQYDKAFPDVTVLKGKGRYKCVDTTYRNCLEKAEVCGEYCGSCKYKGDRESATETANGVFSVHSYLMLKARKDNLLIDEAHSLTSIMIDQNTVKLWQHKVKYPNGIKDYGDVIAWLEKAIDMYTSEKKDMEEQISELREADASNAQLIPWVIGLKEIEQFLRKYERVLRGIRHRPTDYFIEHITEEYRGKPAKALQIRPTTLEDSMGWLWPTSTKKIVLTSATVSQEDIKMLGLSGRRVAWIKAPEAIPTVDKPIKAEFVGNMSFRYQDKSIPNMANKILELQQRHSDTKGLVHATYGVAAKLKKHLRSAPNIIWHDQKDKEARLKEFTEAPVGTVFVASGMSEGLDLAGPDYGWQAITKVQWPSKTDKLISYWYDNNMDLISWMVARDIIQACGRINRYEGDYAITYLLDNMFGNPQKNRRGFIQQFRKHFSEDFLKRLV